VAHDTPVEEIPIDDILDSFTEPDSTPQPAVVQHGHMPPPPPPARPRASDDIEHAVPVRGAKLAAIPLFTRAEPAVRAAVETVSEPRDVGRERVPSPVSPREPAQAEASAAPAVARAAERRAQSAARSEDDESVSSLAPAEVRRPARRAERSSRTGSDALTGTLLVAAMTLIGVGGWFGTKWFYPYPGPPSRHVIATVPAAAAATTTTTTTPTPTTTMQAPSSDTTAPTAPPEGTAALEPVGGVQTATAAAQSASGSKAAARRAHPGAKLATRDQASGARSTEAQQPEAESPVLRVVQRSEQGDTQDIPSKADVLTALGRVRSAVSACAHGMQGTAQLDITVADSGFVTSVVVGGDFAGTPEGSCIARAVRAAQFAPFKKPRFRLIYPFSL
jgi:hypothetical protein